LVRQRTSIGLSQKESAGRIGVDPATLAKWEQEKREPQGVFLKRVKRFLDDEEERRSSSRRAG
jgi:transcriptional regulator with XRE-family HTH domain